MILKSTPETEVFGGAFYTFYTYVYFDTTYQIK